MAEWGVGSRADDPPFDTTVVGKHEVDLIFGEHPHSRCDNNMYARWKNGDVEGFSGHRLLHEIKFKDHNYLKESELSGNEVRKGGNCEIYINGFLVDTFFYREIDHALSRAYERLGKIHENPIRLWNPKERASLTGRKVYWKDHPAIITSFIEEQVCVCLEPDPPDCLFPLPAYHQEDIKEGQVIDVEPRHEIKDSVYSPHIWWWRQD